MAVGDGLRRKIESKISGAMQALPMLRQAAVYLQDGAKFTLEVETTGHIDVAQIRPFKGFLSASIMENVIVSDGPNDGTILLGCYTSPDGVSTSAVRQHQWMD